MGLKLEFIKSKTVFGLKCKQLKRICPKEKLRNHRDLNDKNHETLKPIFFFSFFPSRHLYKNSHWSQFPAIFDTEVTATVTPETHQTTPPSRCTRTRRTRCNCANCMSCVRQCALHVGDCRWKIQPSFLWCSFDLSSHD